MVVPAITKPESNQEREKKGKLSPILTPNNAGESALLSGVILSMDSSVKPFPALAVWCIDDGGFSGNGGCLDY